LDIKFRQLPKVSRRSSLAKLAIECLQGFGYLQDVVLAVSILAWMLLLLSAGVGLQTYEHLMSLPFACLLLVIFATDLYRQRFYLQPEIERGIHWRAGLLRMAKWVFTSKALWLVLRNQPFEYVVTPKQAMTGRKMKLAFPVGVIAAALAAAWICGWFNGRALKPSVYVWATTAIGIALGLIFIEWNSLWKQTPQ
jgi:hypothetical protein